MCKCIEQGNESQIKYNCYAMYCGRLSSKINTKSLTRDYTDMHTEKQSKLKWFILLLKLRNNHNFVLATFTFFPPRISFLSPLYCTDFPTAYCG